MCEYRVIPYSPDMDHPYDIGMDYEIFPELVLMSDTEISGTTAGDMAAGDVLEVIPAHPYLRHRWRKTMDDGDGHTHFKAIDGVIRQHRRLLDPTAYPFFAEQMLRAAGVAIECTAQYTYSRRWPELCE